jgi:hypothetical protein
MDAGRRAKESPLPRRPSGNSPPVPGHSSFKRTKMHKKLGLSPKLRHRKMHNYRSIPPRCMPAPLATGGSFVFSTLADLATASRTHLCTQCTNPPNRQRPKRCKDTCK